MQSTLSETDGTGRLRGPDGTLSSLYAFIMEGKESWGSGGGGNPAMQIAAYYTRLLLRNRDKPAVQQTFFPAVAVEVVGHCLRWVLHYTFSSPKD